MTIEKHWKLTGFTILAALLAWIDFMWVLHVTNRPVAIMGATVCALLSLFVAVMIGRLFVFLLRHHPAQLTAVGVWLLVLMMGPVFVMAITHM